MRCDLKYWYVYGLGELSRPEKQHSFYLKVNRTSPRTLPICSVPVLIGERELVFGRVPTLQTLFCPNDISNEKKLYEFYIVFELYLLKVESFPTTTSTDIDDILHPTRGLCIGVGVEGTFWSVLTHHS